MPRSFLLINTRLAAAVISVRIGGAGQNLFCDASRESVLILSKGLGPFERAERADEPDRRTPRHTCHRSRCSSLLLVGTQRVEDATALGCRDGRDELFRIAVPPWHTMQSACRRHLEKCREHVLWKLQIMPASSGTSFAPCHPDVVQRPTNGN
jgi:hypothetical protein